MPDSVSDPYFEKWLAAQGRHMEEIEASFSPIPIFTAPLFDQEMFGMEVLEALGEQVFDDDDPLRVFFRGSSHEIVRSNGGYEVVLNLPLVEKKNVDLSKKGPELSVRVGQYRRHVLLPDSMARLHPSGAKVEDGKLRVWLDDAPS